MTIIENICCWWLQLTEGLGATRSVKAYAVDITRRVIPSAVSPARTIL